MSYCVIWRHSIWYCVGYCLVLRGTAFFCGILFRAPLGNGPTNPRKGIAQQKQDIEQQKGKRLHFTTLVFLSSGHSQKMTQNLSSALILSFLLGTFSLDDRRSGRFCPTQERKINCDLAAQSVLFCAESFAQNKLVK